MKTNFLRGAKARQNSIKTSTLSGELYQQQKKEFALTNFPITVSTTIGYPTETLILKMLIDPLFGE